MFIRNVTIKNFRGFDDEGVTFRFIDGINAIIGANNSGKSSLIDALRICFSACDYHKEVYFSPKDFHVDLSGNKANYSEIKIEFDEVSEELLEIKDPINDKKGIINFKFYSEFDKKGIEKIRVKVFGGGVETNILTQDFFEMNFNVSYLNALRNVENDFLPNKNSIVSNLLRNLFDENGKEELVEEVRKVNINLLQNDNITAAKQIINKNIKAIEGDSLSQKVDFEFIDPKFDKIISSLKSKIVSKNVIIDSENIDELLKLDNINSCIVYQQQSLIIIDYDKAVKMNCFYGNEELKNKVKNSKRVSFDLAQNGLGYNNIIYISTILGDMENINNLDLFNIFLIEEPEAHLHPQLQRLLQLYFEEVSKKQNIQILYTTHSPSLASSAQLESINLLSSNGLKIKTITLSDTKLTDKTHINYIRNFLDVTKSQLLFSKGVVFVEGVSEALLIHKISEKMGMSLSQNQIEIVNINGVAFRPFVELLSYKDNSTFLNSVIITDDDCCTKNDDDFISEQIDYDVVDISSIKEKLKRGKQSKRCDALDEAVNGTEVVVKKAKKTFEYEIASVNIDICLNFLKNTHPNIYSKFEDISNKNNEDDELKAIRFWLVMKNRPEFKSDFSRYVLSEIPNDSFVIPNYLKEAIEDIVKRINYEIK